ncbi:MAG: TolC family protein [Ferruginibacter sp.]|nr:TolC family protein [Ferruginibacter sp.]
MNNNWKFLAFISLMLSAQLHVAAQQSRNLSLEEAISLSLQNSKNLRMADAKIIEAVSLVQEARDRQLPDFKLTGSYLRLNSANVDLKTANDSSSKGGGPKISQAVYGMANLSLPLYAGGRIKYGIESAKYLEQATRLDADNDKEAVIYNASSAFINLYKASQAVGIVKENLRSSLSRDSNFINLEKNGILARNDLLKAQLQSANIELSLLDAENNFNLAMVNMNLMLGLPENTLLSPDTSFTRQEINLQNFSDYETLALQKRKDIQATAFRKNAATTAIKSARAEAYPTIALTGGYVAAYIPKLLTITNAINIGVGVQYNLASLWKTNTKLQQAKARLLQVSAGEEMLNDAVRLEVNKDYQQFLLTQKKIEVYDKAVAQATENYRITNNKYNNSLVTITDLLEADVALLQARLNSSFAKADAVLAYNKLLQSTGTLSK